MDSRRALMLGAILAGLSVATGAFGAHWLEGELHRRGVAIDQQQRGLAVWDVAVRYQMYHALGLVAVGLLGGRAPDRLLRLASLLFLAGVVIFSGCLYALVLSGVKILGAIVPIGGVAMIAGWIVLAVAVSRATARGSEPAAGS